ncbi:MAG: hypothetical protein LUI08_03970, partial [Prevotella sp.]|nr:hypothetical protein [Prevotella sp.]
FAMTRTSTKLKKMNLSCDCNTGSICGLRDAVISVACEVNSKVRDFAGIDLKPNCKVVVLEGVDLVPDNEGCVVLPIN